MIKIEKDLASPDPKVFTDKNRLMQVLVNIIKNSYEAIDALDNGENDRRIIFRTFSNPDLDKAGFEISDTGIGVEPDQIESIFEFGSSTKGASGFGLHYCKTFVETGRGSIEFKSQGLGKGAAISVSFPSNDRESTGLSNN